MKIYELIETEELTGVRVTQGEKVSWIPLDPSNSDYAEYLRYCDWVDAGNDPADFWGQSEL